MPYFPNCLLCRYVSDYPTGRLLRDAKLYEIGAGTSEIRRMLIGRELFKEAD
jgi:isovaleryl-CoA dehydrogenase